MFGFQSFCVQLDHAETGYMTDIPNKSKALQCNECGFIQWVYNTNSKPNISIQQKMEVSK